MEVEKTVEQIEEPKDKIPEAVKTESKSKVANLMPVEDGALTPLNADHLASLAKKLWDAGAIPDHLKNLPQVIAAWNFAASLKLPPQPSLRNIAVIEGSPQLFGDLPLGLVQRHKDYVYYDEFCIDSEYKRISFENKNLNSQIFAGVVLLQRKGMKEPQSFHFTLVDANRAGLIERANKKMPWHTYPQVMFIRKARIIAIRALFADALTGAGIAEDWGHAPDLAPLERTVDPIANEINETYGSKQGITIGGAG